MNNFAKMTMLAGAVVLAGCSETGFQNFMGTGKDAPDESQVRAHQNLAVPPDLALKAPGNSPQPAQPSAVANQQQQYTTPPTYQPADPVPSNPPQNNQQWQQAYQPPANQPANQPQQIQPNNPAVVTNQPQKKQDIYEANGISRYKPDGTKKSTSELNEEMRQLVKKRKQSENPNYGTIWNMENVFKE